MKQSTRPLDFDADLLPITGTPSMASQADLTAVLVPLLKGVTYRADDAAHWAALQQLQARVRDHVAVLGLELTLDDTEGYAFLRARVEPETEAEVGGVAGGGEATSRTAKPSATRPTPRLVARRPLSFPVSLLLALLRKKLAEFDAAGGDTRLILSRDQVVELARVFMPEGSNDTRLIDQVDMHLNRIVEMGFVRRLRGQDNMVEVQRILKAFVDAQWLAEFDARLSAYRSQLLGPARED